MVFILKKFVSVSFSFKRKPYCTVGTPYTRSKFDNAGLTLRAWGSDLSVELTCLIGSDIAD